MKKQNKKGFTLAELLIVLAIIAILVAIMFPVFGAQLKKARAVAELSNVRAKYSELVADQMLAQAGSGTFAITIYSDELKADAQEPDKVTVTVTDGDAAAQKKGKVEVSYDGMSAGSFDTDPDVRLVSGAAPAP